MKKSEKESLKRDSETTSPTHKKAREEGVFSKEDLDAAIEKGISVAQQNEVIT